MTSKAFYAFVLIQVIVLKRIKFLCVMLGVAVARDPRKQTQTRHIFTRFLLDLSTHLTPSPQDYGVIGNGAAWET